MCVLTCVGVSQPCVSFSTFLWYLWHRSVAFYSDECVTLCERSRNKRVRSSRLLLPPQTHHKHFTHAYQPFRMICLCHLQKPHSVWNLCRRNMRVNCATCCLFSILTLPDRVLHEHVSLSLSCGRGNSNFAVVKLLTPEQ